MLVKLYSKHKKYSTAEKILRQAMHDMPEEADIYYLLAQIYMQLKNKINYTKYLKMTVSKELTFTGDIEKVKRELEEAEANKK